MKNNFRRTLMGVANLCLLSSVAWAGEDGLAPVVNGLQQVAQYNFAIHILAMLLVGFGFLMVFVRKYGYGATTGTYLVVAVGLPLYVLLRASGILCGEPIAPSTIKALLYAEFSVASALIAMGAVLGRLRVFQYALLALLLVPAYLLNEWLVLDGGLGGLIVLWVVPGVVVAQLIGIVVTVALALGCGLIAGALIKFTGTTRLAYEDREEFTGLE